MYAGVLACYQPSVSRRSKPRSGSRRAGRVTRGSSVSERERGTDGDIGGKRQCQDLNWASTHYSHSTSQGENWVKGQLWWETSKTQISAFREHTSTLCSDPLFTSIYSWKAAYGETTVIYIEGPVVRCRFIVNSTLQTV